MENSVKLNPLAEYILTHLILRFEIVKARFLHQNLILSPDRCEDALRALFLSSKFCAGFAKQSFDFSPTRECILKYLFNLSFEGGFCDSRLKLQSLTLRSCFENASSVNLEFLLGFCGSQSEKSSSRIHLDVSFLSL